MNLLMWVVITGVIWHRWWLFERFIKKTGMYLADTLLCIILAAKCIAVPGSWPVFNYILAVILVWIAFYSGRSFLHQIEKEDGDNV